MKNVFKFGFLALVVSLSVAACGDSEKKANEGDSTTVDSTVIMNDSAVPTMDTTAKDSIVLDTAVKK